MWRRGAAGRTTLTARASHIIEARGTLGVRMQKSSTLFHSDRERVEHLFSLYEKLTAPLLPVTPKTRGRRSQAAATTPRSTRQRTPGLTDQTPSASDI